ncbi:hypothetical protein JRQ81_012223 [Phrynocephalus forsythii]|uniref:Uncharacterized protein n=1 Tax=Phrynocephalus forsythii TaxID=171643 RepID=A0A9Q1AQ02_9SAUR|nr:hypothetical protein JRQ81_012223 [Phrynocephalus forsythii]
MKVEEYPTAKWKRVEDAINNSAGYLGIFDRDKRILKEVKGPRQVTMEILIKRTKIGGVSNWGPLEQFNKEGKILSQKDIKNLKEKGYYKIKDMHELMSTGGGINKLKGILGNQKWMVAESMKRRYDQWFHSLKGKEDRQWEVVYKKYEEKKMKMEISNNEYKDGKETCKCGIF